MAYRFWLCRRKGIAIGLMEVRNSSWVFKGRGLCKRNLGQSGWVVIVLVGKKNSLRWWVMCVEDLWLWIWIQWRLHLQWARILVSSDRRRVLACGSQDFSLRCSIMVGDPTWMLMVSLKEDSRMYEVRNDSEGRPCVDGLEDGKRVKSKKVCVTLEVKAWCPRGAGLAFFACSRDVALSGLSGGMTSKLLFMVPGGPVA